MLHLCGHFVFNFQLFYGGELVNSESRSSVGKEGELLSIQILTSGLLPANPIISRPWLPRALFLAAAPVVHRPVPVRSTDPVHGHRPSPGLPVPSSLPPPSRKSLPLPLCSTSLPVNLHFLHHNLIFPPKRSRRNRHLSSPPGNGRKFIRNVQ